MLSSTCFDIHLQKYAFQCIYNIRKYVFVYFDLYKYTDIDTYICVVHMYICKHSYTYTYEYIYVYTCIYIYIYRCIYAHTYIHTYIHIYV